MNPTAAESKPLDGKDLIAQTVKEVLQGLMPAFQAMALTPDKIREANKPYEDPIAIARELRERENNRKQFHEDLARTKARQDACSHKDDNEKWAICLQHNFPDHMPRGICPLCQAYIEPAHWVDAANEEQAQIQATKLGTKVSGHCYIVPEHQLYHIVRWIESKS